MHAWEQIQKTVDYIEEHISEEMSMEELAGLAALSPFYFQRLFSRLVKKPVMEYVRLRRMARAAELLREDRRILDIALDVGLSSHEHFTRTFKETFGMTPEEYRKNPVTLNRMTKPQLALHYTMIDEGVPLVTDGIVLEIGRKTLVKPERFIGHTARMPVGFVDGLGVDSGVDPLEALWTSFHKEKGELSALLSGGGELGVSYPDEEGGYFRYFAGGQAQGDAREGFDCWELPAGRYIVCTFEAEHFEALVMDALYKAQQYLFGVWLPRHGLTTAPFCVERYASHGQGTTKMEIWVQPLEGGNKR